MADLRLRPDDRLDRHDWNAKSKVDRAAARLMVHNRMWVESLSSKRLVSRLHCPRVALGSLAARRQPTRFATLMLPELRFARLDAPIVLAHGLFGFTRIGIGRLTVTAYFRGIPRAMADAGNRVLVTRVPPIAGTEKRARRLADQIERAFPDEPIHLIGHSMGGLDARRLLANAEWQRRVLSLTTIGTPHLGTPLADYAKLRVGRIYRLMASLGIDPQGCLDITRRAARRFHRLNPSHTDIPTFSVAGDPSHETVCWPLQRTSAALWELEGPNDGLVSVESALAFGTPLPLWPLDHFRQLDWLPQGEGDSTLPPPIGLYAQLVGHLASLGFGGEAQSERTHDGVDPPHLVAGPPIG
jgi:triacylglycerol lipase